MNKKNNVLSEIKVFLQDHSEEIQQLATHNHKEFLGVKKYRKEIIEQHQTNHNIIVSELAKYLEQKDIRKGLKAFKLFAVTIAKDSINDKLTIEEAVDSIIFLNKHCGKK